MNGNKQSITDLTTGEEPSEEEKAHARALIAEGKMELAPGVLEDLEKMGLTPDDIAKMLSKSLGAKLS